MDVLADMPDLITAMLKVWAVVSVYVLIIYIIVGLVRGDSNDPWGAV